MRNLEIENILKLHENNFISFHFADLIKNSTKISTHDIHELKLKKSTFKDKTDFKNNTIFQLCIAICDKKTKEVIDYRFIRANSTSDEKTININIMKIENQKTLDNYTLYITIIAVNEQNFGLIETYHKYFYKPAKLIKNNYIIHKKMEIISLLVLVISTLFTIIHTNIHTGLIDEYGFVENLINESTISYSILEYFLAYLNNYFFIFLSIYIVILLLVLMPALISFIFETIVFLTILFFPTKVNLYKYKLRFRNEVINLTYNLKEVFNFNFLFKFTLITLACLSFIFAAAMLSLSEDQYNNPLNYKMKITEVFLKSSYFPEIVLIQKIEDECKKEELDNQQCLEDILVIGYDDVYTYYYPYKYISELLNKKGFQPIEITDKLNNNKELTIYELYATYLNTIDKSKIKSQKNEQLTIVKKSNHSFYYNK